jgi:hypothetical protein
VKSQKVVACHAGLECGILGTNYPDGHDFFWILSFITFSDESIYKIIIEILQICG